MPGRAKLRGLDRYLLRGEYLVAEIHRHRIVLLKPFLAVVGAAALAIWIDLNVGGTGSSPVVRLVWAAALVVLAWALWRWAEWRNERFVVTDKRILLFRGFVTKRVPMMPLTKVTDMTYERSILGRLLGYGTFVLESAGQDQALSSIEFVPDPDDNYRAICSVVFGMGVVDDEDEGGPADEEPAWETSADFTTRLGVVDGVYVGGPPPAADGSAVGHGASIYRSRDLVREDRDADTGELPPYDPDAY